MTQGVLQNFLRAGGNKQTKTFHSNGINQYLEIVEQL